MADKKIIDLPVGGALTGTEKLPVDQGGATVQVTVQSVANLAPTQDHNTLTNLTAGDAHPQYLNQARADLRYALISRLISTGNGLLGGGDLSTNRVHSVLGNASRGITVTVNGVELDIVSLGQLPEAVDGTNDKVPIYNQSETRPRYVSPATLLAGATGFVPTGRVIGDGAGLTGGGDLSVDRTLAVGQGTGITVNANDVQLDLAHVRNVDHSAVSISTTTGLSGGGNLTASRTLSLDTTHSRNVDHAAVSITAGTGLTGGGDITASRTLGIDTAVVPTLAGANIFSAVNVFSGLNVSFGKNGTTGYVTANRGNATTPGYYSFHTVDDIRRGYIGFGSSTALLLVGEAGWTWDLFTSSGATVPWAKITGTKNADQLQGIAASGFVQLNSAPQLSALGVGTSAGAAGSIRATGDISGFFSSDRRFKENIETIPNALAKLTQLRGVYFDWTKQFLETHGPGSEYFYGTHDVGVIAQEVREVLPEVVRVREDGTLAVKYEHIVPLLIEAIKELSVQVAELKAKLA
jgi:hypothetical protein